MQALEEGSNIFLASRGGAGVGGRVKGKGMNGESLFDRLQGSARIALPHHVLMLPGPIYRNGNSIPGGGHSSLTLPITSQRPHHLPLFLCYRLISNVNSGQAIATP